MKINIGSFVAKQQLKLFSCEKSNWKSRFNEIAKMTTEDVDVLEDNIV